MKRRILAAVSAILLATTPGVYSVGAVPTVYQIEDLGTTLDGFVPTVTGMNALGQLSGFVDRPDGLRAVRFTNGSGWAYLPGLQSVYSAATAINASGDLAGYYFAPAGLRAFRYVDGPGVTTIPVLPGGSFAFASAIAANGDVVGYGHTVAGTRAWRASPGMAPIIPATLAGSASMGCGVNAAGQMVGSYITPAGKQHAFRVEADDSLTDIGTLEGPAGTSNACALDADGRVGGSSSLGPVSHAFVSGATGLSDVDTFNSPSSSVAAIANGVSVGLFTSSALTGETHAMVHTVASGSIDLNTRIPSGSGWVLSEAIAVTSNGQIAGHGFLAGRLRAFRLTPGAAPDTAAPVITSLTATPASITPPNRAMVSVTVAVSATDNVDDAPSCGLTSIAATGATDADSAITGPFSASVRAVGGRTYSLTVTCRDAAGNPANRSVDVVVPPDTTAPVITALSASPDHIWPPNGKMEKVTLSVTATDDVDAAPQCSLTWITGAPAADAVVTGRFTASVRSEKDAVYTFNVGCADKAGNQSQASVRVAVSKDSPIAAATKGSKR